MKIGLINIDSKLPNIALMKLSAYHKAKGDEVEWWRGLLFHDQYDKVYASKIFKFSNMPDLPDDVEIGGTGYDLKKSLPWEIEMLCPDYDLYPDCDYSVGFITRGCFRKCKFCVVPEKEGEIHFNQNWEKFRNPRGKHWVFLDNNILAYHKHEDILREIIDARMKIDFNQATDIRLVNESNAKLLVKIRWKRYYRFSFDWPDMAEVVTRNVTLLKDLGMMPYRIVGFLLVGFNTTPEEDMMRIELLRALNVRPFVMAYDKSNPYQRKLARWVNHRAIFNSTKWEDFKE